MGDTVKRLDSLMENIEDDTTSYKESPSFTIAKILREKGYYIVNSYGDLTEFVKEKGFIIAKIEPNQQKTWYGGVKVADYYSKSIAEIQIGENYLSSKKTWELSVHGRDNVKELVPLLKKIQKAYTKVHLSVILESEAPYSSMNKLGKEDAKTLREQKLI